MVRLPRHLGVLNYAAAWLLPWRSVFWARPSNEDLAFLVHRKDVIGRHIAKYGSHEPALTKWIADRLSHSPPGLFVDIGANLGWHVVHAARQAAVETVVAFEPDPFNAWLLDQNLSRNKIGNAVVCPFALGPSPGIASLHRYKESNLGRHSLISDYGLGAKLVPVLDLDRALEGLGLGDRRILILKIDVEGYEPAVVEGASKALARSDVVIIEQSPSLCCAAGLSVEDLLERMRRHGFAPFVLEADNRLTPFAREQVNALNEQMDVVWMRNAP